MSRLVLPSYTVIRDTREKDGHGWLFNKQKEDHRPPKCNGTILQTLKTSDYSLVGYEDILAIERKADYSELFVNYGKRELFEQEMERMSKMKYKYVLIESPLTGDHFSLSPPQFQRNMPGRSMLSWLVKLGLKFDIHFIPVGQSGKDYSQMIFEEVIRQERDRWAIQE